MPLEFKDFSNYHQELAFLKKEQSAPEDMNLEAYYSIRPTLAPVAEGLIETPLDQYKRVAIAAAKILSRSEEISGDKIYSDLLYALRHNYLGMATPVSANFGRDIKALPISCFVLSVPDSIEGIFSSLHEAAKLTYYGGGVGIDLSQIRPQGQKIKGGGHSNGAKPWASIYDAASSVVSQAGVRRGQFSFNFDIDSPDLWDFLLAKDHSKGNPRHHLISHLCVNITDSFMNRLYDNDPDAISRWNAVLRTRILSGSPYLHFIDNANKDLVQCMKNLGKKVTSTNICTEITSCSDLDHTMVCCLGSLNIYKYDDWKNWVGLSGLNLYELGVYFLDAVMEEFIEKTADLEEYSIMKKARNYAIKGRPLGLGVFGYHAYLMSKGIPFDSPEAESFNEDLFGDLYHFADEASWRLGELLGSPEWTYGRRNIQTTAIAPTVRNSIVNGGVTPGIEPISANYYEASGAVGSFSRKNPVLKELLSSRGHDTPGVWNQILEADGSVQALDDNILTEREKNVFKTFSEIDARAIIKQASHRQRYLEQTQSVNLSFKQDVDAEYINDVHLMGHQMGLHTLYYARSESVQKRNLREAVVNRAKDSSLFYEIVTTEGCSWCDKAKELILDSGSVYTELKKSDMSSEQSIQALNLTTFPKIFLSGELVGGYVELLDSLVPNREDKSGFSSDVKYDYGVETAPLICESCDG